MRLDNDDGAFDESGIRIAGFDDPGAELRHWLGVLRSRGTPIAAAMIDRIVELDGVVELARLLSLDEEHTRRRASAALWLLWHRAAGAEAERRLERAERILDTGDYPRCIEAIDRILADYPDFAEAFNKRATARFLAGEYEGAIRDCGETLERNPIHFGAWHGLGLSLVKLQRYREALAAFGHALALQPHEPGNARGIALCERELASGGWSA